MDSDHATEEVEKLGTLLDQDALDSEDQQASRVEDFGVKAEAEAESPEEEQEVTLTKTESPEQNDRKDDLAQIKSLEKQVSLPREILVVGLISLAQLTTQIGLGGTLAILDIIGEHFQVENPSTLSWLIAGYSLTVGTFILLSGRLGDIFGWKKMLVIGYTWFAVWSIIAGLAWYSNDVLFIFARIFQGIGPSISMPNAMALLGGLYEPGPRKNYAFSLFGACAPWGGMLGSTFAGIFALGFWPWTYWSFGMVLAILAFVAAFVIPDPQGEKPGLRGKSFMDAIQELDLLGATTGVTALILFNFAWNQAPGVGWGSPYVIVTLILGVLLMPAFFYVETKVARNPLLPLQVFTSDNAFVLGCVACGWSSFGIWYFYLWQRLQVLRGTSVLLATAYLSPIAISGGTAAILTGYLLSKLRPAWIMVLALCCFFTGNTLVATLPVHQIYWAQIFVCSIITPFGMDFSFPSATLIVSNSVDKSKQGVAASLVNTIVNYSISLGLGFAGTVEVYTNHGGKTKAEILQGYKGAGWMGMGLSGAGIFLALSFLLKGYWTDRRRHQAEGKQDPASAQNAA